MKIKLNKATGISVLMADEKNTTICPFKPLMMRPVFGGGIEQTMQNCNSQCPFFWCRHEDKTSVVELTCTGKAEVFQFTSKDILEE